MKSNQRFLFSLLSLLMLCAPVYADNSCNTCVSHEFVPRTITTDLAYTNLLNFWHRHHMEKSKKLIYAGTFLYQQSRKSSDLGSTFLRGSVSSTSNSSSSCATSCRSNCINVTQDGSGNVNSYWLGLANNNPANPFASTFCVSPERRTLGYYGYFYFDLSDWVCGLWFDASSAIINVRHTLNCCEQGNTATACAGVGSVAQALNNPIYQFGKFNCSDCEIDRHRTGIDDIQLRLGYERNWCNDKHIGGIYAIGTIPTGDEMNAEYIFQPTVGTRHASVGVGIEGECQLWNHGCEDRQLAFMFDANYRYAFKRSERRTFDLCKNGQFSRFLLVVDQANPAAPMPGVNFFTQPVDVTPRSTAQAWLALHYAHCDYNVEIGYNFFWRQQEKLNNCNSCFTNTIGIYQLGCPGQNCTTASTATIAQGPNQIVADATFVTLTQNDLNLNSAAAGSALSNKFYIAAEINRCAYDCLDWFAAVGGSYEFVTGNYKCTTLPVGAVFAKFGLIF